MDYFTLQFFFVLLAGIILGGKRGALAVGCYVALGLIGIPIFAAGGGIGYIFRPSFGYLLGFIDRICNRDYLWEAEKQLWKFSFGMPGRFCGNLCDRDSL